MLTYYQKIRLQKLLNYLYDNNPFYRNRLKEIGFELLEENDLDQIYSRLPIITKEDISNNLCQYIDISFRENFETDKEFENYIFQLTNYNNNYCRSYKKNNRCWSIYLTSGSMGIPLPVIKSDQEKMIFAIRLLKNRKMYYSDATIENGFLLAHEVDPFISRFEFRKEGYDFREIVEYFLKKKPKWIFATANTIKKMTKAIKKFNLVDQVAQVKVRFIEVTSESLTEVEKKEIEEVFKSTIVDQYGSREFWNIAYMCECKEMHVYDSNLIVDICDEQGQVLEIGQEGKIVVTSLVDKCTPFVKYDLGDNAKIINKKCKCGSSAPILQLAKISPREKLKHTPYSGTKVFRRVLKAIYASLGIKYSRVKIIQDADYHLSVFVMGCENEEKFKEKFLAVSENIIEELSYFTIDFFFGATFDSQKDFLKEQVFICKV